jgi:predicted transcriptional regulator
MKLGLYTIHPQPKDSLNTSVTPVHPQPKSSKPPFPSKKSVFLDYMIELGGEPNLTSGGEPSKQKVL